MMKNEWLIIHVQTLYSQAAIHLFLVTKVKWIFMYFYVCIFQIRQATIILGIKSRKKKEILGIKRNVYVGGPR
jgi:hypothetical protein